MNLPDWATRRCDDCGELFLPRFGSVWCSRQPDRHTHGGLKYCEHQRLAQDPENLALQTIVMYQALVEIGQSLNRFMCETDDENWTGEVSGVVFAAMASAERGMDARKIGVQE